MRIFIALIILHILGCNNSIQQKNNVFSEISGVWIGLEKKTNEFILLDPCDGDIPEIIIKKDSLIDKRGIDEPVKYKIVNIQKVNWGYEMNVLYTWSDGNLKEDITIMPLDTNQYVFKWIRKPFYNDMPQDTITSFYTLNKYSNNFRKVKIPCDEKKIIEDVKKAFD